MNEFLNRVGEFIEAETGYTLTEALKENFGRELKELLEEEYSKGYSAAEADYGV